METTYTVGKDTNECLQLITDLASIMRKAKDIDKRMDANMYIDIEAPYLNMRNELMNLVSLSISNALFEGRHEV